MSPAELRVGNIVLLNGKEQIVENLSENWVNRTFYEGGYGDAGCTIDEYNDYNQYHATGTLDGVPLTEERFAEWGFAKYLGNKLGVEFFKKGIKIYFKDNAFRYYLCESGRAWIEYEFVHEIQNLYHALYNENL